MDPTYQPSQTDASLTPVHLHDLEPEDEPRVLALMAALGLDAFEDTNEERLYPFNELTRIGMRQAALMAAELGDCVWSRDDSSNAAADHLARQKREDELIELLQQRPPTASNPWAAEGLQRLWELCCENDLERAMAQLASMIAPGPGPWKAAASSIKAHRHLPSLAKFSGSAEATHPQALLICSESRFGADAMRVILSYPDFKAERFVDPWISPAKRADAELLRSMAEMGAPVSGWSPKSEWAQTPWDALCQRDLPSLFSELESARMLFQAGHLPASSHLEMALLRDRQALADQIELFGAQPTARCADVCFSEPAPQRNSALIEPTERLWRWLESGQIDLLEPSPPRAIGARGARAPRLRWAADVARWAGNAPEPERSELSNRFLRALCSSKLWHDPASRALLFESYPSGGYNNRDMMEKMARALSASNPLFAQHPPSDSEALEAFWMRATLESSVPLARAPSKPSRSL